MVSTEADIFKPVSQDMYYAVRLYTYTVLIKHMKSGKKWVLIGSRKKIKGRIIKQPFHATRVW